MSFVTAEDVCKTVEGLVCHIWEQALNLKVPRPFPRMSYREAMTRLPPLPPLFSYFNLLLFW